MLWTAYHALVVYAALAPGDLRKPGRIDGLRFEN